MSGTWLDIVAAAREKGLNLRVPEEIKPMVRRLNEDYDQSVAKNRLETEHRIAGEQGRIVELQSERGLLRRIKNWFEIQFLEVKIHNLRSDEASFARRLRANIDWLAEVPDSQEFAGAGAELNMARLLQGLPDNYTVLNDVRLTADRLIRFNQSTLMTAQIDHLVVTPAGIFVVETKRWSKDFVASGDFHDPFKQIERSAYLCYDITKRNVAEVKVRNIVASDGALPTVPPNTFVKVLRPKAVNNYLLGFSGVRSARNQMDALSEFLLRFVHAGSHTDLPDSTT